MKRTKTRLLTLLLVLTMVIGMLPLAVLSVAAQGTVDSISVGEDGAINDLDWNPGYMLSETAPEGDELWTVVAGSWEQAYYYTDIVRIPAAGTTLIWSEPVSLGVGDVPMLMGEDYCFVTSWKETAENVWEINKLGANIKSAANYTYDAATQTVIYTYTTTQDNEALRFGCYGGQADGSVASNPGECPQIYAFAPAFNAEEGIVENVKWLGGYVGSYSDVQGFANAICYGAEGYIYTAPIMVSKAGTTILFNAAASTSNIYAFSAWGVAGDGRLEMIYGCPGGDSNSAWLTVDAQNGSYTYAYTTSYDNEIVRLSCSKSGEEAPVVRYVENNESEIAPTLKAAGYDPAIGGTPYILPWYEGAISADTNTVVPGNNNYRYSDVLTVYGKGTKVTFVDVTVNADVGADGFIGESALVFGKFSNASDTATILDSVAGLTQAEREMAAAAGKKVFTYTTTEDKEYLRMTIAKKGNAINGYFVAPIVYVGGADSSYSVLSGKTIVALGDDNLRGGNIGDANTWLSLLASRYDMNYYNYSINGSILTDVEIGAPCVVESYESMVDNADVVVLAAGKNDYLNRENPNMIMGDPSSDDPTVYYGAVKAVVDGLMEKYPDAVIVCVAAWEEDSYVEALASYAEALNSDRVCVIRPYEQMSAFMQDDVLMQEFNGIKLPNVMGNRLVLPLFERMIGDTYLNYHGQGVKFMVGETVVDAHGTSMKDVEMIAPQPTDAVSAENMFGWYGVVTNGQNTKVMLIRVGEAVTFEQGDVAIFEPLTLDIRQVSDPTLRLVNNTVGGLRFLSGVSKAGYQQMLDMIANGDLEDATLSFGTLIAAHNDVLEMDGGLTHAALAGGLYDIEDVPFKLILNAAGNTVWYQENEEFGYIAGTVSDIAAEQNATAFIAAGYVKLTFEGEDYYAYANNTNKKGTSIYELAIEALNDVSTERDSDHKLQIGKNLYSAYSLSDRKILRTFVDNVVALKTSEDGLMAELIAYENYDPNSNWEVVLFTEADGIWPTLIEQLGNANVEVVCMLVPIQGMNPSAAGGILLDGFTLDCEEIQYAGSAYYLIGFSEYSN